MTPIPSAHVSRFEQLGFGLFLHYGLYSQWDQGEWIALVKGLPWSEYDKLKAGFAAADFDARAIARLAKRAGARYCTLTARHHDGFSLYDTRGLSDYDALHAPAKRDLIKEFVEGCRAEGIVPFIYHTTLDWRWASHSCDEPKFNEYLAYLHASVELLCTHYGEIGGFWFDGNWSRKADWKEDRLYKMIRRLQPGAIINDNSGLNSGWQFRHPDLDCMAIEQAVPVALNRDGWPKYVAGESCQTMNTHWGRAAGDFRYLSPTQIIENLVNSRRAGANYQLNAGLTGTGAIPAYERATLELVGDWLTMHPQPFYTGKPSGYRCQGRDFVLEADGRLYYVALDLSVVGHEDVTVPVGSTGPRSIRDLKRAIRGVRWLDNNESLSFTQNVELGYATLNLTGYPYGRNLVVRVAEMTMCESQRT